MDPRSTRTAHALRRVVGGRLARRVARTGSRIGAIVVWHGISERADDPGTHVSPALATEVFAAQLRSIARTYEVVALSELPRALEERRPGGRVPLALTFDDDLASHADVAAPLLGRMGLPATFFLTGATLEREFDHWRPESGVRALAGHITEMAAAERDRVAARLRELAEVDPPPGLPAARVRDMARQGFEIGFHTLRHHSTLTLDDDGLARAMADGRDAVAAAAGAPLGSIAYPHGRADGRAAAAARAAGFELGAVTGGGPVRQGDEPLLLDRVDGWARSSGEMALRLGRAIAAA